MLVSFASNHLALVAITGGTISAGLNIGIKRLLDTLIDKKALKIRETLFQCLIASFTIGLLLSVIYYAFGLYGFPESRMTPIQIIAIFTLCVSFGDPLLDAILRLLNRKLFA